MAERVATSGRPDTVTLHVAVEHVWKSLTEERTRRRVDVLEDITFHVKAGEFFVIVGPSGCGKTTILNLVAGFWTPDSGEIKVSGHRVEKPSLERVKVFQEFALFPWLTVYENIEFGLKMQGKPNDLRQQIVRHLVQEVGLQGSEQKYPKELSGGMKQRTAIARALAVDPTILLMDEPFGSLDAQTREYMQSELIGLWKLKRKTIIFVTHSIEEAVKLADRVIVLSKRPAKIKKVISISATHPRDTIRDQVLNDIKYDIAMAVKEEFSKAKPGE